METNDQQPNNPAAPVPAADEVKLTPLPITPTEPVAVEGSITGSQGQMDSAAQADEDDEPPTATIDNSPMQPLAKGEALPQLLYCLADDEPGLDRKVAKLPNMDMTKPEDQLHVIESLRKGFNVHPTLGIFRRTMRRKGSNWRQSIESENGILAANKPQFKDPGTKLTGEKGMMHIRALLGFGSLVQVPMWHSGFWMTFKAPSDSALLELERRIAEEKVSLGRRTHGLMFANNSVFFNNHLIDFALDHVYSTTLTKEEDIKDKLKVTDIPILIWGLACTIWPNGFEYARTVPKTSGDGGLELRKGKLSLGKLQVTDLSSLTKAQTRHMSNNRNRDMSDDSLARYFEQFGETDKAPMMNKRIRIDDMVEVELHVPSVKQYLLSGTSWINNIVTMVDRAFQLPPTDNRRDRYIDEHGAATYLRQYAHFIKAIHFADGTMVDTVDDVDSALDVLSENITISKSFYKQVIEFMEDSTITAIGIPAETEEDEGKSYPRLQHILPLDVGSTFFILLQRKSVLIRSR